MNVIKENNSELKIHNFYKGLTIVNPATILNVTDENVTLKTADSQLKVVHITKIMTISSEIFPKNILCRTVIVNSETQSINIQEMSFMEQDLTARKFIRLEPDANHSCTFSYNNIKFPGQISIIDISEVSIKIGIDALPAWMEIGSNLKISFSLTFNGNTLSITTDASVYRIDTNKVNYYLVTLFELNIKNRQELQGYLVGRQMELIREYKKMDVF